MCVCGKIIFIDKKISKEHSAYALNENFDRITCITLSGHEIILHKPLFDLVQNAPFGDKANEHTRCNFDTPDSDRHVILEHHPICLSISKIGLNNFKTLSHRFVMMKDTPCGSTGVNDTSCTCIFYYSNSLISSNMLIHHTEK